MITTLPATLILLLLLFGPLAVPLIERNLEVWCILLGLAAATVARIWSTAPMTHAATAPLAIMIAVIVAGILFAQFRPRLDRGLERLRWRSPAARFRPALIPAISPTLSARARSESAAASGPRSEFRSASRCWASALQYSLS